MRIIDDLIRSSDVSKNKKRNWERHKIIPLQILRLLHVDCGLPSVPKKGLNYDEFLDWLYQGPFKSDNEKETCRYFYKKLVMGESIPWRCTYNKEVFLKATDGKLISRSQAKDIYPGSLF